MLPEHERSAHLKHCPDIDGLRAIAILAVVGFHACPHFVRGGFYVFNFYHPISRLSLRKEILLSPGRPRIATEAPGYLRLLTLGMRNVRQVLPLGYAQMSGEAVP